ncbi:hypothetical protein GW17_00000673 [Ensete ventricosum]|nr:hypothetical protein GW17_00000673 [Ensete ventricosum]
MWLAPWRVPQHLAVKIRVIIAAMAGIDVQRIPSPISIMSWECNSIPWVPEMMKEPRNQDCDARAPNKEKWSRLQWGSPHRGHCPSVLEVVVSRLASQVGDASTCGSRSTPKDGAKRKSRKLPQEEEEKGKGLMVGAPYHGWRSSSTDSGEDATATRRTSHSYKIRILEQRTPKKKRIFRRKLPRIVPEK